MVSPQESLYILTYSYTTLWSKAALKGFPWKCQVIYHLGGWTAPSWITQNVCKAQTWELMQLQNHSPSHGSMGLNSPVITVIYTFWYISGPYLQKQFPATLQPLLSLTHICTCLRSPVEIVTWPQGLIPRRRVAESCNASRYIAVLCLTKSFILTSRSV